MEQLPREQLREHQLLRLNALLDQVVPQNQFYAGKLGEIRLPLASLDQVGSLPLTAKHEISSDDPRDDFARNRTFPLDRYVRFHRTSGTRGRPICVLDTADDWQVWIEQWQYVLDEAEVTPGDRVVCAFSFGPFVGFWSAFDAVLARGAMAIPTGGMSTAARLQLLREVNATVVLCTPSYALHLAQTAVETGIELGGGAVRCLVVAGEPGGSIAATRRRIEAAWNAHVVDHAGATEVGPWGYPDRAGRGLFVNEASFLCEVLDPKTQLPVPEGQAGELILTTLDRIGCPVIRYRTGDMVVPVWNHSQRNRFVWLDGGVLGRVDDMLIVRGVNIFPSSLDEIVREFAGISEYRITINPAGELDRLQLEVEADGIEPARIASEFANRLGLQVDVTIIARGDLPRYEGKANRIIDRRPKSSRPV